MVAEENTKDSGDGDRGGEDDLTAGGGPVEEEDLFGICHHDIDHLATAPNSANSLCARQASGPLSFLMDPGFRQKYLQCPSRPGVRATLILRRKELAFLWDLRKGYPRNHSYR